MIKKCFLDPRPDGKLSEHCLRNLELDRPPNTGKRKFLTRIFELEGTL